MNGYGQRWEKKIIWESQNEKLLGLQIDNELSFKKHLTNICKKANTKLTALRRYCTYLTFEIKRILFKTFVESQFSYCPLVWMFHTRSLNDKINKLHERALRMVYDDDTSTFKELLVKDRAYTIHERNIQTLAIQCFKVINKLGPSLLDDIFTISEYNGPQLRNKGDFVKPSISSVHFGENSLKHLGPKIWDIIPIEIKSVDTLERFKSLIKKWVPNPCPCRMCRPYIYRMGFVNVTE